MRVNPVMLETLRLSVLRAIADAPGISAGQIRAHVPVIDVLKELPIKRGNNKPTSNMRYADGALQALKRAGLVEHKRKAVGKVVQRAGWYVTRKGRAAL